MQVAAFLHGRLDIFEKRQRQLLTPSCKFTTYLFPLSNTLNSCSFACTTLQNLPLYLLASSFFLIFGVMNVSYVQPLTYLSWNLFINLILIFSRRVRTHLPLIVPILWLKLSIMLFVTWSLFTTRSKACFAHKYNG